MTSKKKSQFTIRPATSQDIEACLKLDHSLETHSVWQMQRREENDATFVNFQTLRLPRPIRVEYPRDTAALRHDLANVHDVLVATMEDVLLGYAQLTVTVGDRIAWLRNLIVDEPYRRHHVGSALLAQAKIWAAHHHANYITLETTTRSFPAIRFMLGRGLIFCGFNDRYYTSQDIAVFFGQNL